MKMIHLRRRFRSIKLMWSQMREHIFNEFPLAPGIPADQESYLKNIDDVYVTDAYHSLSIERHKVTPEFIELKKVTDARMYSQITNKEIRIRAKMTPIIEDLIAKLNLSH